MKKASMAMLCILMIFIGIVAGTMIGRQSTRKDITISYTDGIVPETVAPTSASTSVSTVSNIAAGEKININTATLAELTTLPDIGEVLAQRIIDYRTENGPFASVEDLTEVKGIGETRLEKLRDHITIGG